MWVYTGRYGSYCIQTTTNRRPTTAIFGTSTPSSGSDSRAAHHCRCRLPTPPATASATPRALSVLCPLANIVAHPLTCVAAASSRASRLRLGRRMPSCRLPSSSASPCSSSPSLVLPRPPAFCGRKSTACAGRASRSLPRRRRPSRAPPTWQCARPLRTDVALEADAAGEVATRARARWYVI